MVAMVTGEADDNGHNDQMIMRSVEKGQVINQYIVLHECSLGEYLASNDLIIFPSITFYKTRPLQRNYFKNN